MADEEFIFHEDSREKKRTACSANKKPIRNSRKCRFPSDYKTKKELNHMSGEVKSYDLSKPMKWGAFSDMPADIQKKYLSSLQLKYHATTRKMSEMFGVSPNAVSIRMRSLGVSSLPRGTRVYPEWESFIKYGTPSRMKDLIPPELREKLDSYEQEHPHVKANVDDCKAEPAPAAIAKVNSPNVFVDPLYSGHKDPSDPLLKPVPCKSSPATNVLDRRMLLDIAYSAGALYALAGACNDSGAAVLNTAAEKLWNIATTVSIGEGKI